MKKSESIVIKMNFKGILLGLASFFIIGIFHPIVIKTEYYFGKKAWPIFAFLGLIFSFFSVFQKNIIISSLLGVLGFTFFWSIHELIEQEERVKKGWFPSNPNK